MYNRYNQAQKYFYGNSLSSDLIRDSSPNKFRNTIMGTQYFETASINRLRNSFSATQINYFDHVNNITKPNHQDRQMVYKKLKNTLNQIQSRIKNRKNLLIDQNFSKKKQKLNQKNNDDFIKKQRQTISTQMTNQMRKICSSKTKISQFITSQPKPNNFHQLFSNPYDSKKFNLYYVSQALRAINQKNSLAIEHVNGSIKMIKSCAEYFYLNFNNENCFSMQRLPKNFNKKTLVLDLDQTLIHCYQNLQIQTDIKLTMNIQNLKVTVGVNIRPYTMTFLKSMAKKFQIVIFTASHQSYANAILDQLDPTKQIFSHRFYRHHCIVLPNQLHVKDLRYLNRDLKDVILVDNAAYSYSFQLQNGIPILPYYEGKDYELPILQKYLQGLLQVQDVRQFNKQYFKLQKYKQYQSAQQLIKNIYEVTK